MPLSAESVMGSGPVGYLFRDGGRRSKIMEEKHVCPVCGKYLFETWNDMDICDVCDWCNDGVQERDPDYRGGANRMSLNEAREAYRKGEQIK